MYRHLGPADLTAGTLDRVIYPDLARNFYWSDCWEPAFYVALARAGFIAVARHDPQAGAILLPELQRSYAVLPPAALRPIRPVARLLGNGIMAREGYILRITRRPARVLALITATHGRNSWLIPAYSALFHQLAGGDFGNFAAVAVELVSREAGELVAGEIGYFTGAVYTSLSGAFNRRNPRWSHTGKLQLFLFGRLLGRLGAAFWNLGHPYMKYKFDLGASETPRQGFLDLWQPAVARPLILPAGMLETDLTP
jgi:hypothetical protein